MPYAYIIKQLQAGYAAKRPNMAGYIKKTIPSGATEGAYELTWVKRDGTTCVYAVSATGVITCASPISLDVELFAAMAADDWVQGKIEDFEAARSGTGRTW